MAAPGPQEAFPNPADLVAVLGQKAVVSALQHFVVVRASLEAIALTQEQLTEPEFENSLITHDSDSRRAALELVKDSHALYHAHDHKDKARTPYSFEWVKPSLEAYKKLAAEIPGARDFYDAQRLVRRPSTDDHNLFLDMREQLYNPRDSRDPRVKSPYGVAFAEAVASEEILLRTAGPLLTPDQIGRLEGNSEIKQQLMERVTGSLVELTLNRAA